MSAWLQARRRKECDAIRLMEKEKRTLQYLNDMAMHFQRVLPILPHVL